MDFLKRTLEELHIAYTNDQLAQLEQYRSDILTWNEHVNLTAITDLNEFERKHYADSVLAAASEQFQGAHRIVDVGTGAGFPGVPLAVLFPDKEFVLMDSLAKRLKIIDEECAKLKIVNVRTVHARAEDMGHDPLHREKYDLCLSRAVANLSTLSEYCLPLVRVGGAFGAYKTGNAEEERTAARRAIAVLGGRTAGESRAPAWFEEDHRIFWIVKESKTQTKYPRKAGMPGKEPL